MTFPVPTQEDGTTIGEQHWNPLVAAINANHEDILDLQDADTALANRVTAVENGKVPTSRTISAGTGLTGGGDLTANRTLTVAYGTAAGTAAQGNDSRITVTQDGTIGNSALGSRVSTLEGKTNIAAVQVASALDASYATNSTSYTSSAALNGGAAATMPGVTFTCPPSGKVKVTLNGEIWAGGAGLAKAAVAIKVSSSNAGDVVAASNLHALSKYNTDSIQASRVRLIDSGLTPGTTYYAQVQLATRESAISANLKNPAIIVEPVLS